MLSTSKLYFNGLIRYHLTSFLKVFIASCSTLQYINFSAESADLSQACTSILILAFIIIIPAFYTIVLDKRFVRLGYPSSREQIGSLYEKMNVKKKAGVMYQIVYLARKSFFVIWIFTLKEHPHL